MTSIVAHYNFFINAHNKCRYNRHNTYNIKYTLIQNIHGRFQPSICETHYTFILLIWAFVYLRPTSSEVSKTWPPSSFSLQGFLCRPNNCTLSRTFGISSIKLLRDENTILWWNHIQEISKETCKPWIRVYLAELTVARRSLLLQSR